MRKIGGLYFWRLGPLGGSVYIDRANDPGDYYWEFALGHSLTLNVIIWWWVLA